MKADPLDLDRNIDFRPVRTRRFRPLRRNRKHRLKASVENGRVQSIVGKLLAQAARGPDLGEHLPIAPPQPLNALKRRTVVVSAIGNATNTFIPTEGLGTALANLLDVDARRARAAGRAPHVRACVRLPGAFGGIGARMDLELARFG